MAAIHPTALVDSRAELAADVEVGAYAVIDGPARLESGCRVDCHALIRGRVVAGPRCVFGPHSVVGTDPQDLGFDPATESGVRLGADNVLRELVTIHRATRAGGWTSLGDHNFLMAGAHLAHDVTLGSHNVLANNVLLAGHVHVADSCFFGGGAGVHQHVRVGRLALAQGNSGLSQDLPPFSIVANINQLAGLNIIGLRRGGIDAAQRLELKQIWKRLLRSGEPLAEVLAELQDQDLGPSAREFVEFCRAETRKGVLRRAR